MKHPKFLFFKVLVRDAFLCALFVYSLLYALQFIPVNSEWLEPAGQALQDFDWSDVYFSKIKTLKDDKVPNQGIFVININRANRCEIAKTLNELHKASPAVVGLDVVFKTRKDSADDAELEASIMQFGDRIVLGCEADSTLDNTIISLAPIQIPSIYKEENLGVTNFIGEENSTVRTFYETEFYTDKMLSSFSFNVFKKYREITDPNPFAQQSSAQEKIIAYQAMSEHYTTIEWDEIAENRIDPKILENKIVLVGFTGSTDGFDIINDKHFTPLNDNYAGKSLPDMYGVYIHANMIDASLAGKEINWMPRYQTLLLNFTLIFLFMLLYCYSESKELLWQNIVELVLQLTFGFIVIMVAVYLLSGPRMKWNIGEPIAAIALAGPFIGFYKIGINYLYKAYAFKSVFLEPEK